MSLDAEVFFSSYESDLKEYQGCFKHLMRDSFGRLMESKDRELSGESYRYMQLHKLLELKFFSHRQENILSDEVVKAPGIYLSNGNFSKSSLDPSSKISVHSLDEGLRIFESLIVNRFSKMAAEEKDLFTLLNLSIKPYGLVLYVPPKTTSEIPIKIMDILVGEASRLSIQPKIILLIGSGADVKIHLETVSQQVGHFYNRLVDIHLEADARLDFVKIDSESKQAWVFDHVRVSLKRHSALNLNSFIFSSNCSKQDVQVSLLEEAAHSNIRAFSLLENKEEAHTKVLMKHLAERTTSHQVIKSVLFDHAKVSFEGKIWVDTKAQWTEAYQVSHSLMMGDHATSFTKPNLEVFTDDVKASHGATIARIGEEPLFYLRSRGLSENDAKIALVKGFCQELLEPYHREPFCTKIFNKLKLALANGSRQ